MARLSTFKNHELIVSIFKCLAEIALNYLKEMNTILEPLFNLQSQISQFDEEEVMQSYYDIWINIFSAEADSEHKLGLARICPSFVE
jgi:hypothetical protein